MIKLHCTKCPNTSKTKLVINVYKDHVVIECLRCGDTLVIKNRDVKVLKDEIERTNNEKI